MREVPLPDRAAVDQQILYSRPDATKSFVHWALEQGFTVFLISWVNPDQRLSHKTFEDYMKEGVLAATDAVRP